MSAMSIRIILMCLSVLFAMALGGCTEKVSMDDPRIQEFLKAADAFDRTAYGFSPIPHEGSVRLETGQVPWARHNYDAMLHWDGRDSRTIAFKKSDSGYLWIGEQEIFEGPHEYQGVDGYYHESITLNYDIEEISGFPINSLSIMYHGEDPRLADTWLSSLTLADVKPILKEWGY